MMASLWWSGAGFALVDSVSDILESGWVGKKKSKHPIAICSIALEVKEFMITWRASGATAPGSN